MTGAKYLEVAARIRQEIQADRIKPNQYVTVAEVAEALAEGRFMPGELLPVPQLVHEFGTGAYEIVRALLGLVAHGYLIIVPDRGHQGDGQDLAVEVAHVPIRCPNCSGTLNAALSLSADAVGLPITETAVQ